VILGEEETEWMDSILHKVYKCKWSNQTR